MAYRSGFVTIIGRPNVGKSTLLNHLVGQKVAIMSDKPQTTRHKIHAILTRPDAQVIFIDTPGIHKPRHRLGSYMVETALRTLQEVDAIVFMVEPQLPGAGDIYILEQLQRLKTPVVLVINKIDLVTNGAVQDAVNEYYRLYHFAAVQPISALYGTGTEELVNRLLELLPEGPQYYPPDMVTDRPERFIMAELIREKILHLTEEEVPHSVAVVIEQLETRPSGVLVIHATIYTERDSQKAILIGKGGRMLKEIGKLAREEMEALWGTRIYLDLWVKVKPDWRNKEGALQEFGYS